MSFNKGDIARNTYDKDCNTYKIVEDTIPSTLFGMGLSLSENGVKLVATGETFVGVGVADSQRNCGNYTTSTDAWTLDVINDGFIMLEITGATIGSLVTVADGGVFTVTTDVALSIGKVTAVKGNIAEVELTGNMITVADADPETNLQSQHKVKVNKRGEEA